MKGIILAGGRGTRLYPATLATSKQLMPVYDKPMIYYPLSVLMMANVNDILIITTPDDHRRFEQLLGDGSQWGLRLTYAAQDEPRGLAEAFLIGANHIGDDPVALALGDNIFHGPGLSRLLQATSQNIAGCILFGYAVSDPHRYGIGEIDEYGRLVSIEEKPDHPRSNHAITGLYFYNNDVVDIAIGLTPSPRGELEISDVNRVYMKRGIAELVDLGRGFTWLDTGTHDSLLEATTFVRTLQESLGIRIGCVEEVALQMGYIDAHQCFQLGERLAMTEYGRYVIRVAHKATNVRGGADSRGADESGSATDVHVDAKVRF